MPAVVVAAEGTAEVQVKAAPVHAVDVEEPAAPPALVLLQVKVVLTNWFMLHHLKNEKGGSKTPEPSENTQAGQAYIITSSSTSLLLSPLVPCSPTMTSNAFSRQ